MRLHIWRPAVAVAVALAVALTACAPDTDVPAWISERATPLAAADRAV